MFTDGRASDEFSRVGRFYVVAALKGSARTRRKRMPDVTFREIDQMEFAAACLAFGGLQFGRQLYERS